jgi:hypothetical protein
MSLDAGRIEITLEWPGPAPGGDVMWHRERNEAPSSAGWIVRGGSHRVGLACAVALASAIVAWAPPAFAAAARGSSVTFGVATLSPLVALIAGILILLIPRLLNFIVAIYLIAIGLIGLLGH